MSSIPGRRVIRFGMGAVANPKYRNKPAEVDGHKFPSQKQAARYRQLLLLQANGELRNLRLEVPYRLEVNGVLICKYRADFVYEEMRKGEWREICEDVKGYHTPLYRLKRGLMRACHGIEIRET